MALARSILDRLISKESWGEMYWISNDILACLKTESNGSHVELIHPDQSQTIILSERIGSSLLPKGRNFVIVDNQLFAFTRQSHQLVQWDLKDPNTVLDRRALPAPATGLNYDARTHFLSWFEAITPSEWSLVVSLYPSKAPHRDSRHLLPGIPFGVSWHPQRDLLALVLYPPDRTPWQEAELYLFPYAGEGPSISLSPGNALRPPCPASPHCLEAQFSPCGRWLLGLWRTGEWFQYWSYDLQSEHWQQLSFHQSEHANIKRNLDQTSFCMSLNGDEMLALRQDRGFFSLERLHLTGTPRWETLGATQAYTYLTQLHGNQRGDRIRVIGSSAHTPPLPLNLWRDCGLWRIQGKPSSPPLVASKQRKPEPISWPSNDGTPIHGFLYRPPQAQGPVPLIMPIHGGPTDQVCAGWPIKADVFVALGYAVLYVNYRGSWGYGHRYHQSLAKRWGELDLADIVSAPFHLGQTQWIDPRRVGLWGGDLGGSTVLRLLASYPNIFRAAVTAFPICEFASYHELAHPLKKAELAWALGSSDPTDLISRSPARDVSKIVTPLAIFYGARDPILPEADVRNLERSLSERSVPVALTIYEEEGHEWSHHKTQEDYYIRVSSFFDQHLKHAGDR